MSIRQRKITLLTLQTFSAAGGIQRLNRMMSYALNQICNKNSYVLKVHACHDKPSDFQERYLPTSCYSAFNGNKLWFMIHSIWRGIASDTVILTHVNLMPAARIIRSLNPGCHIVFVVHGIEVWQPLTGLKAQIGKVADTILCVSNFTREHMIRIQKTEPEKCHVLHNPLDPFMDIPSDFSKPLRMLAQLGIRPSDQVIISLSRIAATEQSKGYMQVIQALPQLKKELPNLKYILAGPAEEQEENNIRKLAAELQIEKQLIMPGFMKDETLGELFLAADLFVLPSKKEGFGLVFTEAMAHGLPVICGNADGSVDTLPEPGMGTAIDPDDPEVLRQQISSLLKNKATADDRRRIQEQCIKHFNITDYTSRLEKFLEHAKTK